MTQPTVGTYEITLKTEDKRLAAMLARDILHGLKRYAGAAPSLTINTLLPNPHTGNTMRYTAQGADLEAPDWAWWVDDWEAAVNHDEEEQERWNELKTRYLDAFSQARKRQAG